MQRRAKSSVDSRSSSSSSSSLHPPVVVSPLLTISYVRASRVRTHGGSPLSRAHTGERRFAGTPDRVGFERAFARVINGSDADLELRARKLERKLAGILISRDVISRKSDRSLKSRLGSSLGSFEKFNLLALLAASLGSSLADCARGFSLPTSACTPPRDDYEYDCDVNRGPTFNHARTGVSLLLLVAFDCTGRPVDRSSLFSPLPDADRT